MYRSILVPLDGSTFSEHALPVAQNIARRTGARLHLAHVHHPVLTNYVEGVTIVDDELDTAARATERDWLHQLHDRLETESQSVTTALLDGSVADALRTYVITHAIDLVVLTTHGRGGVARTWMGSVGDALMRQCAAPVLLLHAPTIAADQPRDLAPRHVLIPLDGSPAAERIIDHALAIGTDQTAYTLLFVVNRPLLGNSLVPHEMEVAEAYLQRVAAPLRAAGRTIHVQVIVDRHTAQRIVTTTTELGVDLIAMTTHGRSGVRRLVIGSTADQVVRSTTMPVLVLRPIEPVSDMLESIDHIEDAAVTR